ncbi:PTS system IIC component, L-Asc family [Anaerovirgula multivorans]|uniref:Ascorbate-specific PTS system EIIC component n=1 Tax=Anaerovirgula multivorans TaxID=312168 RepID=A0A239F774_9FIRM|nr:PTS ascorbate transporter subunit IIC [Anaerovirgula multivorans]SNS51934.1 PTS system IIC component, L-Asc family [Anaerovirgula multivorans]
MSKYILDILSTPAILVGAFALIGLLLQKAKTSNVISGSLKATLGFVILGAGAGTLIGSLNSFSTLFEAAFHVKGVIPNNEAVVALALEEFGTATALIMVFGMVVNLVLARFTKLKYVFLTGHHTLFMACMIAAVFIAGGLSGPILIASGALILGLLMVVMPAILQPFTRQITGNDDIALGHFGSFGYLVAAVVGKYFGDKSKSTEDLKVPESLSFLRDTSVSISLTMLILFAIVSIAASPAYIEEALSGGQNWFVWAIIQSITFAAGVYVVLAGVRMLIAEIVPAFKGISDKLIPDAKPALDCPIVFPFAPNAVIIGFAFSFIAGLIGMFITPLLSLPVIVPGLIPHFFTGATAGVYGNATGGRRGAVLGAFANGALISILPALLLPVLGSLGFASTTFGDADFGIVGIILGYIIKVVQ